MKYPMAATTLLFHRRADGNICVTNDVTKIRRTMTDTHVRFLHRLDGKTDPYSIRTNLTRQQIDTFLNEMDDAGFLRHSRVFDKWIGTIIYTVWIPKPTRLMKSLARVFDRLLRLLWIPVLVCGMCLLRDGVKNMDLDGSSIAGWIVGMLLGISMHELSHGLTAIANGAHFFEAGLLFRFFLPGAYAMIDEDSVKGRSSLIRINAAGVEMNFLLSGAGSLIAAALPISAGFWIAFSLGNLLLALPNLLFFKDLDGYRILILLLGKENDPLFPFFFDEQTRKDGKRKLTVFSAARIMLLLWQLSVPLLLLSNIVVMFD